MKKLRGWTVRFIPNSREGFCWRSKKVIDIGIDNNNIIRLLLHEIAHVNVRGGHTQDWLDEYLRLCRKLLRNTVLSKSDNVIIKVYGLRKAENE